MPPWSRPRWRLPEMRLDGIETTRRRFARYPDRIVVAELANPFKTAWQLCGFNHFMTLMALNPGFVDELFEHLFVHETEKAVIAARAGADIVALVGDVAGAHGPMFSPAMWNAFLKPGFARLIRAAKAANPSVRAFFHSDGELAAMIPAFIDTGIEILNPVESNCMDPAALKREFGDRIAFHGAISVQRAIPRGTVADVTQEVHTRIRTVGYDGGYMVSNENSFPFDAPLANILAMYEAVRDFDYDSLR